MYVCLLWLSERLAGLSVIVYGWHHGWSATTFMPINTQISQAERFLKTSQFTINKNGKKKKKKKRNCFAMLEIVFWKATWGWECRCVFMAQDTRYSSWHLGQAAGSSGRRARTLLSARPALLTFPPFPGNATCDWNSEGRWRIAWYSFAAWKCIRVKDQAFQDKIILYIGSYM